MAIETSSFDVHHNVADHFAWVRTALALQRTLMAAVRTSVSLIGFGFTVAQFFEKLRSDIPEAIRVGPDVSRLLGLILIGSGVISLMIFTWQYRAAMNYLRSGDFGSIAVKARPLHKPSYLVALAVILIGIAAFLSVYLRV